MNVLQGFLLSVTSVALLTSRRSSKGIIYWIASSLCLPFSAIPTLARPIPAFQHQGQIRRQLLHTLTMAKLDSPSAQRNKEPIWEVFSKKILPLLELSKLDTLNVLEIAAGTGVHTDHFARKLQEVNLSFQWFPTDPESSSRDSIQLYISDSQLSSKVHAPLQLTLDENGIIESSTASSLPDMDVMICINMIHISPWQATIGLMKTAAEKLRKGGVLYCYGPYKEGGTAVESNMNFDRSLQLSDARWGVRNLEDVVNLASEYGLTLVERVEMPANNLSVLYRKQ